VTPVGKPGSIFFLSGKPKTAFFLRMSKKQGKGKVLLRLSGPKFLTLWRRRRRRRRKVNLISKAETLLFP